MPPKAHASRLSSPVAGSPTTFRISNLFTLIRPSADPSPSGYQIINANRSITTWRNTLLSIQARNSTIPVALALSQMSQLMGGFYLSPHPSGWLQPMLVLLTYRSANYVVGRPVVSTVIFTNSLVVSSGQRWILPRLRNISVVPCFCFDDLNDQRRPHPHGQKACRIHQSNGKSLKIRDLMSPLDDGPSAS